ncbi:MAG: HTH domain-containing protein [Micrococcaceae bacterium]
MPAYIEPAGAKLEKALAVEQAKAELDKVKEPYDKARANLDKVFMEALEYGVSKAELARRMNVAETTVYRRIKKLKADKK